LSRESAVQLTQLRDDILKRVTQLIDKRDNGEEKAETNILLMDGVLEVHKSLEALSSMMAAVPKENIILQSIFFSSMNLREGSMESAKEGTFEWIFERQIDVVPGDNTEPDHDSKADDGSKADDDSKANDDSKLDNDAEPGNGVESGNDIKLGGAHFQNNKIQQEELEQRAKARDNFTTWLRSGTGVFHISGKPGSGKSTLMKFLCSHERTQEELRIWAGESKKPVFARFYFWKSSTDKMQMTLPGLHRSILFETLKHCPDLIPVLFPRQWEVLTNGLHYIKENLVSDADARVAFEALTAMGSFPKLRFCFFVDGLDEYDANIPEQVKLSKDLKRWASGDGVKICASSRPYIAFEKLVASDDRRIDLHQLTKHDIYTFARKMIEDSLEDDDLERVRDYYLSLVEKVVKRSEGVFLWARLVVCSLLDGLLRHDGEGLLGQKLDTVPPDIHGLYKDLLGNLSPDDRERAEKMMLLTAHKPHWPPLSSVAYTFVDELSDPEFPPKDGKKPKSWKSIDQATEDVRLQLKSLTKGLLETVPMLDGTRKATGEKTVQFFHRTVCDFVLEHLKDTVCRFSWIGKSETYYRLWLAELMLADLSSRKEVWERRRSLSTGEFRQELPPDLLESFNCTLRGENPESVNFTPLTTFTGVARTCSAWSSKPGLSFIDLAAYCGQREYVLQQAAKSPELLKSRGEFHILMSAALGNKKDLVRDLFKCGSSALDSVDLRKLEPQHVVSPEKSLTAQRIPVWVVFTMHLVGRRLRGLSIENDQWEILQIFLDDPRVDASKSFFLVCDGGEGPYTHFFTLRQFIEDLRPQNTDQLLALFARETRYTYFNGARRFLSRFAPNFNKTDTVVEKELGGYTPLQFTNVEDVSIYKYLGIFGDLKVERLTVRIY
jgi:hypothetical protein